MIHILTILQAVGARIFPHFEPRPSFGAHPRKQPQAATSRAQAGDARTRNERGSLLADLLVASRAPARRKQAQHPACGFACHKQGPHLSQAGAAPCLRICLAQAGPPLATSRRRALLADLLVASRAPTCGLYKPACQLVQGHKRTAPIYLQTQCAAAAAVPCDAIRLRTRAAGSQPRGSAIPPRHARASAAFG